MSLQCRVVWCHAYLSFKRRLFSRHFTSFHKPGPSITCDQKMKYERRHRTNGASLQERHIFALHSQMPKNFRLQTGRRLWSACHNHNCTTLKVAAASLLFQLCWACLLSLVAKMVSLRELCRCRNGVVAGTVALQERCRWMNGVVAGTLPVQRWCWIYYWTKYNEFVVGASPNAIRIISMRSDV